jgi:hypothetical protein
METLRSSASAHRADALHHRPRVLAFSIASRKSRNESILPSSPLCRRMISSGMLNSLERQGPTRPPMLPLQNRGGSTPASCSLTQLRAEHLHIGLPRKPAAATFHRCAGRCDRNRTVPGSKEASITLEGARAGLRILSSHLKQFECVGPG